MYIDTHNECGLPTITTTGASSAPVCFSREKRGLKKEYTAIFFSHLNGVKIAP
jgi:hypothetical protein